MPAGHTMSLRTEEMVSLVFPPLRIMAVLSFSCTCGSFFCKALLTRWFFAFLQHKITIIMKLCMCWFASNLQDVYMFISVSAKGSN